MKKNKSANMSLKRGLITVEEYVEYLAIGNGWKLNQIMPAKQRREVDTVRKEAEAMQKFNGVNILYAFEEVMEDAENYEEALEMVIEGGLLYESIPYNHQRREEVELYGHQYVFEIIEEEFSPDVWIYVRPTDIGAVVDLATEAEARRHARFFYDLAY